LIYYTSSKVAYRKCLPGRHFGTSAHPCVAIDLRKTLPQFGGKACPGRPPIVHSASHFRVLGLIFGTNAVGYNPESALDAPSGRHFGTSAHPRVAEVTRNTLTNFGGKPCPGRPPVVHSRGPVCAMRFRPGLLRCSNIHSGLGRVKGTGSLIRTHVSCWRSLRHFGGHHVAGLRAIWV